MNTVRNNRKRTVAYILNYLMLSSNLDNLVISLASINDYGCSGNNDDNEFCFRLSQDESLIVMMKEDSIPLMDAFSISVADFPFCKYKLDNLTVIEWPKDSDQRYEELRNDIDITFLKKFI